jgi:hypothetical protein
VGGVSLKSVEVQHGGASEPQYCLWVYRNRDLEIGNVASLLSKGTKPVYGDNTMVSTVPRASVCVLVKAIYSSGQVQRRLMRCDTREHLTSVNDECRSGMCKQASALDNHSESIRKPQFWL